MFADLLPEGVHTHADFPGALAYLGALDPDVAAFHYFIEWNLRDGAIDLTFTFPTRFAGIARIPLRDLVRGLGRSDGLVDGVCERLAALPLDAPHFPRAVSFSLGPLARAQRGGAEIELAFLDYGPALDLCAEPELLCRAFTLLQPGFREQDALERVSQGLALAHVGAGRRAGRPLHKVYLAGSLAALTRAVLDRGASALVGPHAPDLERLAAATGPRTAHLVADVLEGELARVGFELNFHLDGAEGFAALTLADPLWQRAVRRDWRRDTERLIELGTHYRPLADGSHARLRISHLKLSFDRRGEPEWKAYLCFQRALAPE
jgi:hypothetical protein